VVYVLGVLAVLAPLVLVVQAARGRVRIQQCCAVDAALDARLRTGVTSPSVDD
jgi:hypothetical protein